MFVVAAMFADDNKKNPNKIKAYFTELHATSNCKDADT